MLLPALSATQRFSGLPGSRTKPEASQGECGKLQVTDPITRLNAAPDGYHIEREIVGAPTRLET